ncbi:MAG TPA: 2-oxoglutarate and iron-dependent oxygenase domain-containing protein [Candidatus Nanopelagicales bacterium]|nr:2-oxoglutarate and iron-dependent oxygenase domain-containing protein [Candidatus Nanopelagicales bacterium]
METSTGAIPVVDLSLFHGAPDQREQFLADLRQAAHGVGFLYVVGHGVPQQVVDDVFSAAREFFALPLEERQAIDNLASPQFRGYTRVGYEHTNGRPDRRDQLDIGVERPALDLGPDDPAYLRLIGPNQWPQGQPELKRAVLAFQDAAQRVSKEMLAAFAVALGQDEHYFEQWFDSESHNHLKVIRYPGRGDEVLDDQGVGAHKDYGFLALLVQDELGGLQVQSLDGEWLDAAPIPGSFVVNIGEMLEVMTSGYLRATVHRVVSPPGDTDRYSVPFFLGPRLDAEMPVMPLPPELAAEARGVELDPDNPLIAHFGENTLKGWLRAHPKVAERWWADVLGSQG